MYNKVCLANEQTRVSLVAGVQISHHVQRHIQNEKRW
jgi:hypothetical protein